MKDISDIKIEMQIKVSDLIKECKMFFAFSNEQFNQNKTPLEPGEKYVDLGHGCYMTKGNVEKWKEGNKDIDKWFKNEIEENGLRKQHIIYELNNHEAFYIHDIESTMEALGSDYTNEEVWEVFYEELQKQEA